MTESPLISEFLANVSHNLCTPLSNIKAAVSGLLETDIQWDADSIRGFLTEVNEEIDRLTAQVRNLLAMGRIEAGALPVQRETCDLTDIVGAVLERLEPLLRGRKLVAKFAPEPLLVEADFAQIEIVLFNLLENAVKYTPPGTPLHLRGEVCPGGWLMVDGLWSMVDGDGRDRRPSTGVPNLATGPRGWGNHQPSTMPGAALFALRDEGPGIPAGEEERIFEKFYRAGGCPAARGTGLGLAICRAIIAEHGGAIRARTLPDGGAEFCFSLPLSRRKGTP